MKNFNFDEVKNVTIDVRCERANVLNVMHAINTIYIGGDGVIDNDYNLGVPDNTPMIDVTDIKTCNDAVIALSSVLNMDRELLECGKIILIDVGGTDECRYLKEDQILWVIYSIEEAKIIDPTFWINIENLAAPGITGNTKNYNFGNRYQTLETLKRSIGDDTDFALEYCYYMNCLFNAQAIKRQSVLASALANAKVLIKAGEYDVKSLDKYLTNKMFMKKTLIRVITPDDILEYISTRNPERTINIKEREYSFLEILKFIDENKWTGSIDFYLQRFYNTDIHSLICDLEYIEKKRQ